MGLTQKYKQKQQQVRVITNESNFGKGMFYTDVPLGEGHAKMIINFDIDSATGKLVPRKGLQTQACVFSKVSEFTLPTNGYNILLNSKIGYTESIQNSVLHSIAYNTATQDTKLLTCTLEDPADIKYNVCEISNNEAVHNIQELVQPEIHNKHTLHNIFFKKPVGVFAYNQAYYTFLKQNNKSKLCYTKLGKDITDTEVLLTPVESLDSKAYYTCVLEPVKNNPTEATSWGYNMLLENPYDFKCEKTAVNLVTITGIIPYDKQGKPVLTPKQNEEVVLKGYYRAPEVYHSDLQNGRFYSTKQATKKDDAGNIIPLTFKELQDTISKDGKPDADYGFGTWCKVVEESPYPDAPAVTNYYMVMPAGDLNTAKLDKFGDTKPGASVKLNVLPEEGGENEIRVHWQYKTGGAATWTELDNSVFKLSEYYATHGDRAPFEVTCTLDNSEVIIKLTISDPADTVSTEEYILSTNTIGISTVSEELSTVFNVVPENYDLGQCTGMCEWEQRLVLWGVPGAENIVFVSDVNNPGYFPYPNNIDILPDPIMSVHNYGNELLVLTTTALYRLIWDAEGTGWTHKLVQRNLQIKKTDVPVACVYKNMFFFKSGNYYYMMVPKATASVQGETTIAPISKTIENLLDNFHEIVYNLFKIIIDDPALPNFTDYLVNYFTYIDGTKIVVNYVYDLDYKNRTTYATERVESSKYFYIQLVYDTDLRTWSLCAFEAAHMLQALHNNVLKQDTFVDLTPLNTDSHRYVVQLYNYTGTFDNTVQYCTTTGAVYAKRILRNYQYLDTGNREINTDLKKRFREVQFKLKTKGLTDLQLYLAFYVDGCAIQDLQESELRTIAQTTENQETVLIVDRVKKLATQMIIQDAGALKLTALDSWTLNQSAFPGRTLWKIRLPIMGKGYTPSAIFLAKNEESFELLGHNWVYRTMNAR